MKEKIEEIRARLSEAVAGVKTSRELFELKARYVLGKAGEIPALMKELGKADKEERPKLGQLINGLKDWANAVFEEKTAEIEKAERERRYADERIDITLPAAEYAEGSLHPVTLVKNELVDIFAGMGFKVLETQEIEDDFHNFTALNTPE